MARGQGEPPEARQAPALRGQSAGILMDCQGHEQGYMQGFAEASQSGPCPLLVHALKLSGIAPAAACHCAVAPPEATGSNGQAETQIGQWKHDNGPSRERLPSQL